MTNGGVSKSTKSLHVSEDVFGGYNVMLRGRDIVFRDYFAVGKGRDMGLETIVTFEAKVRWGTTSRARHERSKKHNLLTVYFTRLLSVRRRRRGDFLLFVVAGWLKLEFTLERLFVAW